MSEKKNKKRVSETNRKPLFDHFLIVGGPYTEYSGIVPYPEILNIFPYAPLALDEGGMYQLTQFCFPQGFHPLTDKEKEGDRIIDFFSFRLNGTDEPYYVTCLKLQVYNKKKLPFFATKSSSLFPFVFCIISSTPLLSSHFQFLTFIATTMGKSSKSKFDVPTVDPLPVIKGPTLKILDTKYGVGTCPKITPSKSFFKQVNLYRSLKQDESNTLIYNLTDEMKLAIPCISSNSIYLAQNCLDLLFSLLSISDIISIYASALIGNYVIFKSENPRYISFSVLGLVSLISPFPLHMPIMPIIPNDPRYLELLNSPVPYIFGICSTNDISQYEIDASATIVNLDDNVIENQVMVDVPYKEDQIKYIEEILEEEKGNILVPQKTIKETIFSQPVPNPAYDEFFTKLCPLTIPQLAPNRRSQKYIFNEKAVEKILIVFSQRIGPWIALVKDEIRELQNM